ncbi:rhomboid family intramembrane serine protease [Bacteroidia bacterium]|nr:rhomboid family intramembrane serine protease [Bacteroidia bacterium]
MNFNNNGSLMNVMPPVTKNILLINGIIWIAGFVFQRFGINLSEILGLHYAQAHAFNVYQLVTYMFTHEEFMHLFFNMFALWMFGSTVENAWGSKKFLIYYMVCGIGAGLTQELVAWSLIGDNPLYHDLYPVTIGASGAVFGLLLAFGMLYPNAPLYLMFIPIPIKAKYFVIGYGVIELFFGMQNSQTDNVAHFAHLGGMLFGLLLILYWRHGKKKGGGNIYRYK